MAAAMTVAVTGDVGAGKSTVSKLLERMSGGVRLDADSVALSLWNDPDVIQAAVERWGLAILDPDGKIVPRAVASRIFSDTVEYRWCCGWLHPRVMKELERRVLALSSAQRIIVEIPLLFEAGRPDWVDAVVFVTASWDARALRCREQRGWDEAELKRREKFFLPSEERMRRSDFVLNNAGGLDELEAETQRIWGALSERAAEC